MSEWTDLAREALERYLEKTRAERPWCRLEHACGNRRRMRSLCSGRQSRSSRSQTPEAP